MTHKEKARELVDKFKEQTKGWTKSTAHQRAKQCAIIYVEGILNEIFLFKHEAPNIYLGMSRYWQNVKQEIQSL